MIPAVFLVRLAQLGLVSLSQENSVFHITMSDSHVQREPGNNRDFCLSSEAFPMDMSDTIHSRRVGPALSLTTVVLNVEVRTLLGCCNFYLLAYLLNSHLSNSKANARGGLLSLGVWLHFAPHPGLEWFRSGEAPLHTTVSLLPRLTAPSHC